MVKLQPRLVLVLLVISSGNVDQDLVTVGSIRKTLVAVAAVMQVDVADLGISFRNISDANRGRICRGLK